MADRDLTPEEARAEIEAFMGERWTVSVRRDTPKGAVWACAEQRCVFLEVNTAACKTAVSALKSAWRDVVRPWCQSAAYVALTHDVVDYRGDDTEAPECIAEEAVARVLKEDQ